MVNNWIGIGHICFDEENSKYPIYGKTPNGTSFYRNKIAIDASYKNKNGEKVADTDFISFRAWSGTADMLSKYTRKGSKIAITGRLKVNSWEIKDEATGEVKRGTDTYILVQHVELLDNRHTEKKDSDGSLSAEEIEAQEFDNAGSMPVGDIEENPFEPMAP